MARQFDGTDDTYQTQLGTPGVARSYSIWARRTTTSGSRAMLNDGVTQSLYDNGGQYVYERAWSTQLGIWSTPRPAIDTWVNVVVTYDGGSVSNDPLIYFNGVSQTVSEFQAPIGTLVGTNGSWWIGSFANASGWWTGQLAEFAAWDGILTLADVTELSLGICPALVKPSLLQSYVPLLGNQSPEPDWKSTAATASSAPSSYPHVKILTPRV